MEGPLVSQKFLLKTRLSALKILLEAAGSIKMALMFEKGMKIGSLLSQSDLQKAFWHLSEASGPPTLAH